MPWTCQACTFLHDDTAADRFLACRMCSSPRFVVPRDDGDDRVRCIPASPATSTRIRAAVAEENAIDLTGSDDENDEQDVPPIVAKDGTADPDDAAAGRVAAAPAAATSTRAAQHERIRSEPPRETLALSPVLARYLASSEGGGGGGSRVFTASPPLAFLAHLQKDNWSCGYRNLQGLATFLLRMTDEPDLGRALVRGGLASSAGGNSNQTPAIATSIIGLQRGLRRAWDAGYDPGGVADHALRRGIVGSRRWIGTPEVASVFRCVGVPVDVRAWSDDRSEDDRRGWPEGSTSAAECLARFAAEYFQREGEAGIGWARSESLPPIYLQRRGHSVTCVGVRIPEGGSNIGQSQFTRLKLLISDPAIDGGAIKEMAVSQLARSSAWEVGHVLGPRLLLPGQGKIIGGDVFAAIS